MFKKAVVAMWLAFGVAASAGASDYGSGYAPVTTYQYVTTYVYKQVPYTKTVCEYYCGQPRYVTKTYYQTIQVPVVKQVPVSTYAKRYH